MQSRLARPKPAPAIQGAGRCCAIQSPAPPPRPLPPRLPAWNQPPARPFSSGKAVYAIRLSTDMPRKVTATFETTTTSVSSLRPEAVGGSAPVAQKPTALITAPIVYHVLRLNVVSAMGAQANFHTCGM